jgi:hypothetical protein
MIHRCRAIFAHRHVRGSDLLGTFLVPGALLSLRSMRLSNRRPCLRGWIDWRALRDLNPRPP